MSTDLKNNHALKLHSYQVISYQGLKDDVARLKTELKEAKSELKEAKKGCTCKKDVKIVTPEEQAIKDAKRNDMKARKLKEQQDIEMIKQLNIELQQKLLLKA